MFENVEIGDKIVAYRGNYTDKILVTVTDITNKYINTRCDRGDRSERDARWHKSDGVRTRSSNVKDANKERITDDEEVVAEVERVWADENERQSLLRENRTTAAIIRSLCIDLDLPGNRVAGCMLGNVIIALKDLGRVAGGDEPAKRSNGRYPHPKCPSCGKPMNKTMTKGKAVKPTDPWAFCRNKGCKLHGKDQILRGKLRKLKKKSKSS